MITISIHRLHKLRGRKEYTRSQETSRIKFSNLFARVETTTRITRGVIFEDRFERDLRYAILVETRSQSSNPLSLPGQRPFIRNPIDCSNRDRAVCNCFLRMLQLPRYVSDIAYLRRAQKLGKNRSTTQQILTVRGKAPFQPAKLFPLMNRDTFFLRGSEETARNLNEGRMERKKLDFHWRATDDYR